jgi:hypothetical protein
MAIATGTYTTYATKGIREQLLDSIYDISPEDTPAMSAMGRTTAKNTKVEWQVDTLAAAADSAVLEGDEYSFATPTATTRVGNYCQINRKTVIVSGTDDAVDKAGRASELAYQLEKRSKELKRDMELAIVGANTASVAGSTTVIRKTGSMSSWLTSNVSRGTDGANGGYNTGTGLTVAATDGTQRAFAEAQIKAVMQSAYANGGKPRIAVMSPFQKSAFSAFAGIAVNRVDNDPARGSEKQLTIMGAADVYKSDFGNLVAVPDNFCRSRTVTLLDPEYAQIAYLRPFLTDKPAKTGDAEKRALLVEWALIVKNEAAHAEIADLTTS